MILEKFKEKKSSVVAALNQACDAMISKNLLPEICDSLEGAWKSKVPGVKANSLAWASRLVLKTPKASLAKIAKQMGEQVLD